MRLASIAPAVALIHLASSGLARAQQEALEPPSIAAPPPAPPAPPPSPAFTPRGAPGGGEAEIRFDPVDPDVSLLARNGAEVVVGLQRFRRSWWYTPGLAYTYAPICEGPCVARVPPGEYHFALTKGGAAPVALAPVSIAGPTSLHAEYKDRSGLRTAGTIVGVGGVLTGVALIVVAVANPTHDATCSDPSCDHVNDGLLLGGVGVLVTSAIVGSILALQRDDARLLASPLRF